MKKTIFLLLLLSSQVTLAQWNQIYIMQRPYSSYYGTYQVTQFFLVDSNTTFMSSGYSIGQHGSGFNIDKTDNSFGSINGVFNCDGGMFGGCSLWELRAINADTVYISFAHPYGWAVEKTCDGGATWAYLPNRPSFGFFMVNAFLGYAVGYYLVEFVNDSIYMVDSITAFHNAFNDCLFFDSLTGIALLHDEQNTRVDSIFRTTDRGATWTYMNIDPGRTFRTDFQKLSDSVAIIHADSGYIFKTTDKGATWFMTIHDTTKGYIRYVGEHTAYSLVPDPVQYYRYYFSTDDGATWHTYMIDFLVHPTQFIMFSPDIGYIIEEWPDHYTIWKSELATSFDEQASDRLVLSPNPNRGLFTFDLPAAFRRNSNNRISIFNSIGQRIQPDKMELGNERVMITLENAAKGVYHVSLTDGKRRCSGIIVIM